MRIAALRENGSSAVLAIVRVGSNPGDIAYERGALKRAESTGVETKCVQLAENVSQDEIEQIIEDLNNDNAVSGVLIMRPLPKTLSEERICAMLKPEKDVDGITPGSMAFVFTGSGDGYPPCTAEACIEILDHYGIELLGKNVTVFGRSLVIGKPVSCMALARNATVTICHSRTPKEELAIAGKNADVVIAAVGKAKFVKEYMIDEGSIVIDVGINEGDGGGITGDVDFESAEPKAAAITPVPGGVGSVTTAVLMKHVIDAAEKLQEGR